ncbi:MAG: GNAT family N-acetyltransferase [Deltaproteobacteria bacterium]|nr:GNAT family N-acetyltransferase [Deltaproteobacteria bacterium]
MKLTVPREEFSELTSGLLRQGRSIRVRAFGNSMFPTIHSGAILRIEPCAAEPSPGEIVFFKSNGGRMTAHRLLSRIEENGEVFYKAKGDFFMSGCDFFPKSSLLGRVVGVEKKPRWPYRVFFLLQRLPFYPLLARIIFLPYPIRYQIVPFEDYNKNDEVIAILYHYPSHWRTKVHKKEGPVKTWALAFVGKKPAGILTLTHPGDTIPPFNDYWIWGLFVRTRYRRLGLAERLMEKIFGVARGEGAKEVNVLVFEDDEKAKLFYQKQGFEPFEDAVIQKHLDQTDGDMGRRRLPYKKIL